MTPDIDVVCLGESMVLFVPSRSARPGRLADVPSFHRGTGGAESNVACALAGAGHTARWISRVGTDGFGDHLVSAVAAAGVDVSAVARDPDRPTGIYFRTSGERATGPATPTTAPGLAEVAYYRAGSAASVMSPETVRPRDAWSGRVLHLSGITAALSPGCRALLHALTAPAPDRPLVSFDVNYRAPLWPEGADPGPGLLAGLARRCDLVLVGEDEAEAAWGLKGPAAIRAALPEPAVLVVKRGASGVVAYVRRTDSDSDSHGHGHDHDDDDTVTVEPALTVEITDPAGAGDAFAAGFLSATLRELPVRDRLRHGHVMAAAALTVPGDLAPPPPRALADALVALPDDAWERLRLAPGWTKRDRHDT